MNGFQILILLMSASILLVGIAQKIRIPYPVGLVIGGGILGFLPGLDSIELEPHLILTVVLPPILYYGAFWTSFHEFKQNISDIFSLALGLVIITTLVVGIIFKWFFPELPWALAFVFGAIVSPPDAVAATSILQRFSIGSRLLTVLEGESLINDASALVIYRIALTALLAGTFSFFNASVEFVKVAAGGVLIGIATGYLIQTFARLYLGPVVGVMFSFTIPYMTYILADALDFSPVLAVVINGLIGARILIKHQTAQRRIFGYAAWDIFIILLNCFVFILIGLQLSSIISKMTNQEIFLYSGYGVMITFAMIGIRMIWIYFQHGMPYLRKKNQDLHSQTLREVAIMGWSGMRGIVSLTIVLALPYTLPDGYPLIGRDIIIFITFIVILLSLIIPGLTLPAFLRFLNIRTQPKTEHMILVRKRLGKFGIEQIERLTKEGSLSDDESAFLSNYFNNLNKIMEISSNHADMPNLEWARRKVLQEQRQLLIHLWEAGEVDDQLLRSIGRELDLEEVHLARAEIS